MADKAHMAPAEQQSAAGQAERGMPSAKKTLLLPKCYLHIRARFESDDMELNPRLYKSLALAAVKVMHGDMGLPSEIDVIQVLPDGSAILRVDHSSYEDLWSALTVFNSLEGEECRVEVLQVSLFLMSFAQGDAASAQGDGWEIFVCEKS